MTAVTVITAAQVILRKLDYDCCIHQKRTSDTLLVSMNTDTGDRKYSLNTFQIFSTNVVYTFISGHQL